MGYSRVDYFFLFKICWVITIVFDISVTKHLTNIVTRISKKKKVLTRIII